MYINSFNHFRAISILLIIAGHCLYAPLGLEFNNIFEKTVMNLVTGGTYLFVFISGLLFHHVFFQKYRFKKFFTKKLTNVFIPYLILGLVPIAWYILSGSESYGGYFLPTGTGIVEEYIVPALKYYVSGRFLLAYWYIPLIMIIFLASPLHVLYARLNLHLQLLIIFAFSTIAIFIHRPIDNINLFQSVVYFTPLYLIGITASINNIDIYRYLAGKELYLLFVVVSLAFLQTFSGVESNYHKSAFKYGGIDLMFFQKIALCFFFMVWLHRFETYSNGKIQIIAETSFALFFIHPIILNIISLLGIDLLRVDSWFIYFIFVIAVTLTCVLAAKLCKRVLRKYSKYLIGY
jgi:surface polysaccharide O-acyltransferase-like enzyme